MRRRRAHQKRSRSSTQKMTSILRVSLVSHIVEVLCSTTCMSSPARARRCRSAAPLPSHTTLCMLVSTAHRGDHVCQTPACVELLSLHLACVL